MKKPLIFLITAFALNLIILAASRFSRDFSEWYAVSVYPFFRFVFSKIFGIFPFSVAEILLAALILSFLAGIVAFAVRLAKNRGNRKRTAAKTLLFTANFALCALLIFMLNCGVNYNRRPFLETAKSASEYTGEELGYVFDKMLSEFDGIMPLIHTDENGGFVLSGDLKKDAPAAMSNLSVKYPRIGSVFAAPKPVITSKLMSRSALAGIFSPFTVEANYNADIRDSEKPFTVCHELAHLSGFMKEEEANFISFLACRESGNPDFMYSAYLSAFQQVLDEMGYERYDELPEQARHELSLQDDYWLSFMFDEKTVIDEDTGEAVQVFVPNPLMEVSGDINDNYLKINGQEDGTLSYGRMIDLIIAVYLDN